MAQSDRGLEEHHQLIEEILHDHPNARHGRTLALVELPPEILFQILSLLSARDLASVSLVCRALREHAIDDRLWARLVNSHLPFPVQDPEPFNSFRRLYLAHVTFWFIPQYKIWFADNEHTGNLIVARYDHRRGVIEAYRLLADRVHQPELVSWSANPDVIIKAFNPTVRLWLDDPVLLLKDPDPSSDMAPIQSCKEERRMHMPTESQHVFSSFLLCSKQPLKKEDMNPDNIWPPPAIPSDIRTPRNPPREEMVQPESASDISHAVFRLRRWAHFRLRLSPGNNETLVTYATLDPSLYTPTPEKPYQGIWVGDYSAHGSEFLLFLQRDSLDTTESSEDDRDDNTRGVIHKGGLAAIKLTGDPNVPRGEVSFAADDIGSRGLIRVANEEPFRGARIVRAAGLVAGLGFHDASAIDAELILMSPDYIGLYWKGLGHASFYRRVDIDALIKI
ncbi:F-box domain protein [Penicillium capsulatum]|uniref:F-box domain protein n=1 Tax=Penicillium capsulatum TaxID=69766 RepID=A0A9W9IA73_9EURO|nr:F-box domain protein [Penicillium capsulatum]KAJ6136302.1 F-box domain protein [Penicillium capsulatum]